MKEPTLEQLLEAGAHFGHSKSHWHPQMAPFIYATRDDVHIIDLEQTQKRLKNAQEYAIKLTGEGKRILFLGTKRQVKKPLKEAAERASMPYVTERWLGGTITNFDTIHRQIRKLLDLEAGVKQGKFEKYTKREQLKIKERIRKLNRSFGGIKMLAQLPDALFIIDPKEEMTAVKEARKREIPIIATVDTNADPSLIDYPVPANDDAIKAITLIVNAMADAIVEARDAAPQSKARAAAPKTAARTRVVTASKQPAAKLAKKE